MRNYVEANDGRAIINILVVVGVLFAVCFTEIRAIVDGINSTVVSSYCQYTLCDCLSEN